MKILYSAKALFIGVAAVLSFNSCIREGLDPCPDPVYEYDVYVVGYGMSAAESGTPFIWKNSQPQVLGSKPYHPSVEFRNSTVQSVWVDGDDVYATGGDYQDDGSLKIWKNGMKTTDIPPSDIYGTGQAITVSGGGYLYCGGRGCLS